LIDVNSMRLSCTIRDGSSANAIRPAATSGWEATPNQYFRPGTGEGTWYALSRPFDDPIKPPRGRPIVTLKDAAAYILKLPKSAQHSPEWQAAGEAVIMAAEDRGPLMHAHVGMMLARRAPSRRRGGYRFVSGCCLVSAQVFIGQLNF
jgi:hypothetical protein